MIGPENLRHSLDQLGAKLKPSTTWSPAFSRALGSLVVSTLSSLGFLRYFFLALISPFDYCGVILRRLIEKRAKLELTKNKTDAERNEGYQFRGTRLLYVCPNHSAYGWNASL